MGVRGDSGVWVGGGVSDGTLCSRIWVDLRGKKDNVIIYSHGAAMSTVLRPS